MPISREEFEELCIAPMEDDIARTVESAITNTGLEMGQIDDVLLAGGSCNIPRVKRKIAAIFSKEEKDLIKLKKSETVVTIGAAKAKDFLLAQRVEEEAATNS